MLGRYPVQSVDKFDVLHDVPPSNAPIAPWYEPGLSKTVTLLGLCLVRALCSRACLKGIPNMSRTPAREALIASGAVSAVVSLCLLGAVATGTPAQAKVESAASSSSVLQPSTEVTGNRTLMSG